MSFEEIKIDTEFLTFAAKRWGNPDGKPVLGLHGWLDNAATFDLVAPFLSEYNFVALDLAGHGRSGHRPLGIKYHYMDYVDDIVAVVDALGWDRFFLLGHSLGGGISTIFAGAFPERVSGLALIEAIGPRTQPVDKSPLYLAESIVQHRRHNAKRSRVYPTLDSMITARTKVTSLAYDKVKLIIERSVKELASGFTWQSDARLKIRSPAYTTEEQIRAFIKEITASVLLIRGTEGSLGLLMTREELKVRTSLIRDFRQVDIIGGHHPHLDSPEDVAKEITAFLARLS